MSKRLFSKSIAGVAATTMLISACSGDAVDSGEAQRAVDHYAEGVHATYERSLVSAKAMDTTVDYFAMNANDQTLTAAKNAWLKARDDYGRTEAFRFYGGPIDDEENGKEGLINAWPLDEAYIDYVEGDATAGVVNDAATYPTIDQATITELNEKDGETNISTGWHAIEFLLWGQDLSETGPGARPVSDYTSGQNVERRKAYLQTTSDLLVANLQELVDAWAPDAENYRADFVGKDTNEALENIFTGIGELSRGELAGERMGVAFMERSQEDEHSCFSDNTHRDIITNAESIRMVVTGDYGNGLSGPGVADLVATRDQEVAQQLRDAADRTVSATEAIPVPFDASLREGVADDSPGRLAIQTAMTGLQDQTDTIISAGEAIGVEIDVT